jgi:hypothetical protein
MRMLSFLTLFDKEVKEKLKEKLKEKVKVKVKVTY